MTQEQLGRQIDRNRALDRFQGGGDSLRYCICQRCDLATQVILKGNLPTCEWCGRKVDPNFHGKAQKAHRAA